MRWTIFTASRSKIGAPFTGQVVLAVVPESGSDTANPSLSADGRTLFVSSNRSSAQYRLFVAKRDSTFANFGLPVPALAFNSAGAEYHTRAK